MTSQQKNAALLAGIYVLVLAVGLWFNGREGVRHDGRFWKAGRDGWFSASDGDRIRFDPDAPDSGSGLYQLRLDGVTLTAMRQVSEDGAIRVDFSDGWRVEADAVNGLESDTVITGWEHLRTRHDAVYTLIDMDAGDYRFAAPERTAYTPFYAADGSVAGELVTVYAQTGEVLEHREVWYDHPGQTGPAWETVVMRSGLRLPGGEQENHRYVNEDGAYLVEPTHPTAIVTPGGSRSRSSLLQLMQAVARDERERWGMPSQAVLYTLLYAVGVCMLLWPNQMAFLGSRWRYRSAPELSEDGLNAMYIGSFILMAAGVLLLFLPVT